MTYYRKDGRPTGEVSEFDQAMKPLLVLYADLPVKDFGPKKLAAVREVMVKGFTDRHGKPVRDASCGVVNQRVRRLRHIFKWAVAEELARATWPIRSPLCRRLRRAALPRGRRRAKAGG